MSRPKNSSSSVKSYNWATILYPESGKPDFLEIIDKLGYKAAVSPLHDMDKKDDTDELKKAHYHILFQFESPRTDKFFSEIVSSIGAVGHERVVSLPAYTRYLAHLDNPEKHQYNQDDIKSFNGFRLSKNLVKKEDMDDLPALIFRELFDNCISNYTDAVHLFIDRPQHLKYIVSHAYAVVQYIKGFGFASSFPTPETSAAPHEPEMRDCSPQQSGISSGSTCADTANNPDCAEETASLVSSVQSSVVENSVDESHCSDLDVQHHLLCYLDADCLCPHRVGSACGLSFQSYCPFHEPEFIYQDLTLEPFF